MSTGGSTTAARDAEAPGAVDDAVPGDLRMSATLWPLMLASALGLVPFTVFSTFLVPISEDAGTSVAVMGGLRGLGGLAALLVGTALAPLLDRVSTTSVAAGSLLLLAASSLLAAMGELLALAGFCLLIGAATAMLTPALMTAAADHYTSQQAAGRAATLMTATQSLTAMLAAPLISLPALVWGWRGDLVAVAAIGILLAVILVRRGRTSPSAPGGGKSALGYRASFRALSSISGVFPLLLVAFLRTAAFMGYLAYLAAFYEQRFALTPTVFAFVWTLSGASFFVGNLVIGRVVNSGHSRVAPERMLLAGTVAALCAVVGFYFSPGLAVALVCTSVLGLGHATVAACVTTLLVRRCGSLRGSALSLNAAGMSLGVFVGSAAGGVGLALAGFAGMAVVFGVLTGGAVVASLLLTRRAEVTAA
ncbi:MFS transporter [Allosaccharopolyspora coralli]|uniref:MFS transporter n=1 Tax=Allosaccharopolyspora coralli TaxID=2665642 RepID=A0A5Q3Q665_9PSEU|nr:MFS transporter [Allosaccharopolyspora coralli]QGK70121.1 MFS transporter [Allosaccharopolyspora coralli]